MHNAYSSPPATISSNTLSSNTLFHFTKNIDHVRSILEEGFRPNLSLEDLSCLELQEELAIPMVSFCDIPLSKTKTHMKHYGYYGIGLSKSWGQKNGINPVLYTYQASPLASSLSQSLIWIYTKYLHIRKIDPRLPHEAWAKIASIFRTLTIDPPLGKQYRKIWDNLLRIQCFIKSYEGLLRRGDKLVKNVRFYDEREWRFVPDLTGDLYKYLLYEEDYNNKTARDKANNEIQERSRISFKFTDVKYIIVHHKKEVPSINKKIEKLKGDLYSPDAIKVLNSMIITAEQILTDF